MSCSLKIRYSFSASFTSVPPYSGSRTVSPSFRDTGISLPSLSRSPGPTAMTLAEFSWIQIKRYIMPPNNISKLKTYYEQFINKNII
uniref:Chaperonin n=1 Tax=Arundo donax TaxID=35708 RepID=A0A0A8XNS7_ARUDO